MCVCVCVCVSVSVSVCVCMRVCVLHIRIILRDMHEDEIQGGEDH